jgi:hypothetical protein
MGKIEGEPHITPEMRETYKQEFAHGVNLFKRSLDEYEKTKEGNKKAAFKDVIGKALHVMNETARLCLTKETQGEAAKLNQDYQTFLQQENPDTYEQLSQDISKIERSL